jgi:hypothetical protein
VLKNFQKSKKRKELLLNIIPVILCDKRICPNVLKIYYILILNNRDNSWGVILMTKEWRVLWFGDRDSDGNPIRDELSRILDIEKQLNLYESKGWKIYPESFTVNVEGEGYIMLASLSKEVQKDEKEEKS